MINISVVIITFNEERNLARCLSSVKPVADEIVVLDSLSVDGTVQIAESFGAKIFSQPFLGYVEQKNAAVSKSAFDWVLSLDADEVLSEELQQNILSIKNRPVADAYRLNRLTNYCGKWIKYCGWNPDRVVRLFNKTKGKWQGNMIHEKWVPHSNDSSTFDLRGRLLHYSYYTFSDNIKKIEKFSEIAAQAAVEKGKSCSIIKIWLGPKWIFFSCYLLKLGFLDGYYGFAACKYSEWTAFAKYTKIRQYAKLKKLYPK